MPAISFDLNLGALFSPLLVLVFGYVVNRAKNAVIAHMDDNRDKAAELAEARHNENVARFDRIETQVTQTNGKVAVHDKDITAIKTQNEMLMRLYLKGTPE